MTQYGNVGKYILDTAHKLKVSLDATFDQAQLTGTQVRILGFLGKNEYLNKDVYQKDIEAEFKIRRSSVTSVLNTMEKNGFIQRQSVLSDARLKKVVLTEKSRQVGAVHHHSIERFEKAMVDNMSPEEIQILKNLLEKVQKNLGELKAD